MFLISGVLLVTVCALTWWILYPSERRQLLARIPGPTPIPLLGNILQLKTDPAEFYKQVMDYCDQYRDISPVYKLMLGVQPLLVVFKGPAVEKFVGSMKNLTKSQPYDYVIPWLRTGLLTSTGAKWQSRRKLLTPTFHFKILDDFLQVFNEQADIFVRCLEEKTDGVAFNIFPYISLCTLDIICESAMGKKLNAQISGGKSEYISSVSGFGEAISDRFKYPWQQVDFIYKRTKKGKQHDAYLKILHNFTQKVIAERKMEMEEQPENFEMDDCGIKKRRAFLDLLLHMAKEANFTDDDIQEEVDTFMFEGHDTTSAGIGWTIYLIGAYQDIQQKLQAEVDEVFGDNGRPTTMEDLTKLKYLECVIKESHRLFPPVPWIGRTSDEDTDLGGITVPKGVAVSILISNINRDPDIFPEPDKFVPERFTQENSAGRHPYSYLPFSAGPRNCIGQRFALNEERCVISTLLRRYNIESTQPIEEMKPIAEMILRPSKGIWVKLTERSA